MATDLTPPDPSVVLDLIEAFRRSKVLFAAVALGVFDALATGPERRRHAGDGEAGNVRSYASGRKRLGVFRSHGCGRAGRCGSGAQAVHSQVS